MRNRFVLSILVAILLMALAGCASAPSPVANQAAYDSADGAAAPAQPALESPQSEASAAIGQDVADDTDRMIIRDATLDLVVTDAAATMNTISNMVVGLGGYVTESSSWLEGDQTRTRMTVRIPAEDLDSTMASIKALAVRVLTENTTGQDVTEEFTDLDAQLVNLEATEAELRELLGEVRKNSQKAEEVLQVYRELSTIRGEIERVKGRMQYLSTLTAMATLRLDLTPDVLAKPVVQPGWRPMETVRNAGRSLVNALKWLADAVIWTVLYAIPMLLLIALPFVLLALFIRWLRQRAKARRTAK